MIRLIESNQRQSEYNEYLSRHIEGVRRSWYEILKPTILVARDEIFCTDEEISKVDSLVLCHDESKYTQEEYNAYLEWFYPSEGGQRDFDHNDDEFAEEAFDMAWLHHQKCNPHHPQYWILIKDSGEIVPKDMPFEYVCEMLCDWHSFTLRNPESTAYNWYQDNKDKMVLSQNTRLIVESLVGCLMEPLRSKE